MLILEDPEVEPESEKKSDDPMINFKRLLTKNKNKTSERQYPQRLKYFFDGVWTKKSKTKDGNKYEKFVRLDDRIEDQAKDFVRYYQEKGAAWVIGAFIKMAEVHEQRVENKEIVDGTIFNYYKAGKKFCIANDIKVEDWHAILENIETGRKSSDDRIPTEDEIKKLVAYPDLRIKGIIYTMLSSGIRRSSWKYMQWKHIQPYKDENTGKVLCAKLTAYNIKRKGKGDKWYYTFISSEAYHALLEYREHRERHGEKVGGESWVMVHKDNPNMQLSPYGIKSMIERAAKNAKLFPPLTNGKKRREWQLTHSWRKYFKTKASEVMDHLIVELCLDHETGLAENYFKAQEPTRRANYLKAVQLLTIEDANKNMDKITTEVTQKVTQELVNQYKERDTEMMKKFDKQDKMIEMMKKQIVYNEFENVIEKLTQQRRALKQYGSISAHEQLEYFMKSSKAKWMDKDDLELLKKMVDSNEILPVGLSPPDEDGEGIDIRPLTKFKSKKLESQIKKLEDDNQMSDEQIKEYDESLEENLEIARKAND